MHSDGFGSGGGQEFNARLPAIIPSTPPEMDLPDTRVAGRWIVLVTAIAASGIGVLGAKVWPYPNRPGNVVIASLAGSSDASRAAEDTPALLRPNTPAAITKDTCHAPAPAPQLVMSMTPQLLHVNEAAPLGLRIDGAPEGAHLVVCGFAAKSTLSAGQRADEQTWTLPVSDVADASLIPPPGFVGAMQLELVLLRADSTVADRKTWQVRWEPQMPGAAGMPTPPTKTAADIETDKQIEEGKRLEAAGNLSQARGIFLRLARDGNPHGAFWYADSYDPISLARHQLLPPESDLGLARIWYRKAYDMGSQEANARLERLSSW
ncbi:MAG: hypothetical protein J2P53_02975 [Bradyrhizobiaceae bacterium]|nr:hypothetical protein [Bradyrhizobiaceae bacterium]